MRDTLPVKFQRAVQIQQHRRIRIGHRRPPGMQFFLALADRNPLLPEFRRRPAIAAPFALHRIENPFALLGFDVRATAEKNIATNAAIQRERVEASRESFMEVSVNHGGVVPQ